jgi:enoyl-CoA hydratase/carnithine racemase
LTASSALEVHKRDRVVTLRVPDPVACGEPAQRLAGDLMDLCAELTEQQDPLLALIIDSSAAAFWVSEPRNADDLDAAGEQWGQATAAVARLTMPTVALLRGNAIGLGCELALACDFRIAASDTLIGLPYLLWDRIPSAGATQRLTRVAGIGVALRVLLLHETLSGDQAHALGLIHRSVSATALDAAVEELVAGLRSSAPIALAYAKEAVLQSDQLSLPDGLRLEADLAALLQSTHDRAEGIAAFLERRQPRFEGR